MGNRCRGHSLVHPPEIDVANPAAVLPAAGYDVVYFDAFAPEKQPEMWDESVFRRLFAAMSPDGILTTYCAKGVVRRLLQSIGFTVQRLAMIFSQLGKNYCPVREKYFSNWGKNIPKLNNISLLSPHFKKSVSYESLHNRYHFALSS